MARIKPVKADDIKSTVLDTPGPAVLDFYVATCAPCRALEQRLERVAEQYAGAVAVYRVDAERQPAVINSFHVTSVPTVVVFKAGKEVARLDGLITERDLKAAIDKAIAE